MVQNSYNVSNNVDFLWFCLMLAEKFCSISKEVKILSNVIDVYIKINITYVYNE